MVFSSTCESRIRTVCEVFPSTEWSGAAFYTYIYKDGKHGTTYMEDAILKVVDFTLQDIGSAGYTEYSLNGDTASYYAEHIDELVGCKICLLHSHHNMGAFFSDTDMSTLREQAEQCNNVLSIVVDNKGTYVAKFTEKHTVHEDIDITTETVSTDKWKFMGELSDSKSSYKSEKIKKEQDSTYIKCWDCDIERPLDVAINKDFRKECLEKQELFKSRKEKEKPVHTHVKGIVNIHPYLGNDYDYSQDYYDPMFDGTYSTVNRVRVMTNSIFSLSFSSPCYNVYSYDWYRDVLSDKFSEIFYACFLEAWLEFYNPNADEIQQVIDTFTLKTDASCLYPKAKNTITTWLENAQLEMLENTEE